MGSSFWPTGILYTALPVFAVVLLIGSIVLVSRGHRSEALNFSLAIILAAALVVTAVGFAQLLAPVLSIGFGRDFTYMTALPPEVPPPFPAATGSSPSPQQSAQAQLSNQVENQFRDDMVYGATMLIVGSIVFGILWVARWFLRQRDAESQILRETYLLLLLITTTIVALASLITAVAQLLRRYVVVPVGPYVSPPHPGAALATAIAFTPLWGWFLIRAIQMAASRAARSDSGTS